ncbi:hypothetical protein KBX37_25780 [Micromonospora sp. U56]|uniref:hypothetical protein n=1 Tax=Micromonospora sp. U56 TaxID=2824900 RepID=UPI001B35C5D1|nr:hypothetical protein [Micromonospora sp. U56]MBQ0896460.1 hypothetical protein [Micromonospora sp. U56]
MVDNLKADAPTHLNLVYFFIPLAEPLGLPDKFVQRFAEYPSVDDWKASIDEGNPITRDEPTRIVSLMFHEASAEDPDLSGLGSALDVAVKAFPALPRGAGQPEGVRVQRTIVEAAVELLPFHGDEADEASVSEALDKAIECIRDIQRAYSIVCGRPVTTVTRERLPAFVPLAFRLRLRPDTTPSWPEELNLFMVNTNLSQAYPADNREAVQREQCEQLGRFVELLRSGRVFSRYPDFVREAETALRYQGEYRVAVVLAATAAEVLLDDLLMHMLWEEARRPEDAAPVFERGLATRVRTQYHTRLGGLWDAQRAGPVQQWTRKLAALRHRVVHAGYNPTGKEAAEAHEALLALEGFITALITQQQQLKAYPRTAAMLLGEPGLKRRGLLSKRYTKLIQDSNEPFWVETFLRWRRIVAQCRANSSDERIEPETRRAKTLAVISSNGTRWWLFDPEAYLACAAHPPTLTDKVRAELDKLANTVATDLSGPISVEFSAILADPVIPTEWIFPYQALPLFGVMVDRSDLSP